METELSLDKKEIKSKPMRLASTSEIMKYYTDKTTLIASFIVPAISASSFPLFGLMFSRILFLLMKPEQENFYSKLLLEIFYFFLVCILMGGGAIINKYIYARGGEECTFNIRQKVFRSILYKHMWWFDDPKRSSGALSNVLSEKMNKVHGLTTESLSIMLEAFLNIAIGVMIAAILNWRVAIVAFVTAPLLVLGNIIVTRSMF